MTWQRYDLIFRLQSPLHSGWRKVSNLQQTRGYVTGKMLWAGLTARLTREAGLGADGQAYVRTGNAVTECFRFSYLYPALHNGSGYKTHYPWQDDFDYLFLDSYASTALHYPSQSAAEGLLHETEYIAPRTRTDQPVYLTGTVYAQTSPPPPPPLDRWLEVLDKLQFGGERGYGWGRVQLVGCDKKETIESERIRVEIAANDCITAHLKAEKVTGVVGPIEPLIGWERNNQENRKANWQLSKEAVICYAPGATVTTASVFLIGESGVLSPASD